MPNWGEVLNEIHNERANKEAIAHFHTSQAHQAFDTIRRKHLKNLSDFTGRNVIAYYSGWQSKPGMVGTEIRDEDRNGFMMAVNQIDVSKGLDVILHTPGGEIAATQSIVTYLHDKFGRNIRAIVPLTAMSAGTIIACSCCEILMGKHSSIGPIDPQFGGVPANGVLDEFKTAYEEIAEDYNKIHVWGPILAKYHPTFLGRCRHAVEWSEAFAREQLSENMFYKSKGKQEKINKILKSLTDYGSVKLHERQINYKEAQEMGLKVKLLEDDQELQDKVLTVHHCYTNTLANTEAFKIIENQSGAAFVKMLK